MMTTSLPNVNTTTTPTPPQSPSKIGSTGSLKIPFENSKIMDECRVEVLRKFRKEIIDHVRFCDVSRTLITCGLVSKEECFEICKLAMSKQMPQCYQKVHDIMDILVCQKGNAVVVAASETQSVHGHHHPNEQQQERLGSQRRVEESDKQNGLVKDIWKNFITALKAEHGQLAGKMENELDKSAESRLFVRRGNSRVRKADIGCPKDFQHVQHYGLASSKKREQGDGAVAMASPSTAVVAGESPSPSMGRKDNMVPVGCSSIANDPEFKDKILTLQFNDTDLQEFFKRAGVESRHLENPVTKQIICRFIAENGGMEAIREEVHKQEDNSSIKVNSQTNNSNDHSSTNDRNQSNNAEPAVVLRKNVRQTSGSSEEEQKAGRIGQYYDIEYRGPPAPATVPFKPTPRPTSNLYYF